MSNIQIINIIVVGQYYRNEGGNLFNVSGVFLLYSLRYSQFIQMFSNNGYIGCNQIGRKRIFIGFGNVVAVSEFSIAYFVFRLIMNKLGGSNSSLLYFKSDHYLFLVKMLPRWFL